MQPAVLPRLEPPNPRRNPVEPGLVTSMLDLK